MCGRRSRNAARLALGLALAGCDGRSRAAPSAREIATPKAQPLARPREVADPLVIAGPLPPATEPDISLYTARIAVDVATRSVSGMASLTYAPSARAGELRLPRNELQVEAVTTRGEPLGFREEGEALIIEPPGTAAADATRQVDIAYHATPKRGLVFGPNLVYTDFFTCHWLPCKEEPGDKASFRLDITVPSTFTVVASGRLVETLPAGPGLERFVWQEDEPHSTYLFGFAAGHLTQAMLHAGQTELRLFGVDMPASELEARFGATESMLRFFEGKATIALPRPTYTQVVVPGSAAQEKSSFSLIGRVENDPILVDARQDRVVAHELAHQWWGNLVTCKDWPHFWLNEGITTFMVAAYREQRWGAAAYAGELASMRERHQRAVDAKFDVKLSFAGDYPSLQIRRAITYSKAALFLDRLRRELGERAFWAGLGRFTRERAGQSVDSKDFQHDLELASGRDLSSLFDAWVYD